VTELHLCARPAGAPGGFDAQARLMYWELLAQLHAHGASPLDIAAEKVFLSDIGGQTDHLLKIRGEFHGSSNGDRDPLPALTLVEQPPARPGQLCEVQAMVMLSGDGRPLPSRAVQGSPIGASGKVIEAGGARHLFLASLTGGLPGDGRIFADQAAAMFACAQAALRREGQTFHDVVRTWIYLKDIDSHYDDLNRTRRAFFSRNGVRLAPASTGIKGVVQPEDRDCGLDLRAVSGDPDLEISSIHAPTLNEAPSYGSDFSRGLRVTMADRSILYISGTASIDLAGRIVAEGDIEGQVDRMLLNVEALLAGQGASAADLVSAVTYLKRPGHRDPLREACRRRGFSESTPHTICVADICRPDWLCEMEAIAVLAGPRRLRARGPTAR
jgi:enamine deaminase RidA (YjgF/YER057c/UK114 family)